MTVGERSHTGTCTGTCTGVLGDRSSRDHCLDRTTKMFQGMCRELTTNQGLPISFETEERCIYDELVLCITKLQTFGYSHIHECEYKNTQPKSGQMLYKTFFFFILPMLIHTKYFVCLICVF